MAQNKIERFGPVAIVTGATGSNYIHPADAGANAAGYTASTSYIILKHLHITNKGTGAATVSLYIGGTTGSAAGTEFWVNAYSVAQNSFIDWYGQVRINNTEYLSGTSNLITTLVLEGEGEVSLT